MKRLNDLDCESCSEEVLLTIGTFDGVHRGHRHLIRQLVRRARDTGLLSAVLTFHPHPRSVLSPESRPTYISTPDERAEMMAPLGLDLFLTLPFTAELADSSAEAFLVRLREKLCIRELWIGSDFALGRNRAGDTAGLAALGERLGYVLRVVDPLHQDGRPISSTRVRELITRGLVRKANELLGHNYTVSAEVQPGARRGRRLGFRTANLRPGADRSMPDHGVYAVWALVNGERHQAVANVGIRPSFDSGEVIIEVHLLDFDGDLYGRPMRVEFVEKLRPEMRFEKVDDLIAQIHRDIEQTRTILGQEQAPAQRESCEDEPVDAPTL